MASSASDSQSAAEGSTPSSQALWTSEHEMTIPVSVPEKELLENNDVVEEFLKKLQDHDIDIEPESLYTDRIVVVKGDPVAAKECLASVICSQSVEFTPAEEPETVSALNGLRERFTTQFALEVRQGGMAHVAFLAGIKQEVFRVLDEQKYAKKFFPLSRNQSEFLQCHLQSFATKLNSRFHPPVELSNVIGPSNQPRLELKCERVQLPKAEEDLVKSLTLFCCREVEVSRSLGGYLQTSAGKESIKDIENKHHCTMDVKTQDKRMLLKIKSPQGHQVEICEGNMATSESPVMVLPLWEDMDKWKQPYHCILQRGGLNTDPKYYLNVVGLPPKPSISDRPCQDLACGQTVIIMYIPLLSDDHFQEAVLKAMTEALKYAKDIARSGIAIPLKLCADVGFDVICHLLTAVCNSYDENELPDVVQFYQEPKAAWPGDLSALFHSRGWITEAHTDTEGQIFDQRVKVVIGDILNAEGDVVVNSTDPGLKHEYGQVSRVFLSHLRGPLIQQCNDRYPGGIGKHIVAVTDAFAFTHFKKIFHVALPMESWTDRKAKEFLQALRTRVEACLCMASVQGFSSIVFPALATGNLCYPAELEARTVLETTREFFNHMPHSPLRKVVIVAYEKNPAVAKATKAEENVQRYSLHLSADPENVEKRYDVRGVLVQAIKGDALTRRCTAQLLICASRPSTGTIEDYQNKKEPDCSMEIVDKSNVRNNIRDVLKKTNAASVQINLQTFDADHVDGVMGGIERASSQTVKIILIVVSSSDMFDRLCSRLRRSFTPLESGRSDHIAQACVGIYGSVDDTKEAIKKVLAIQVPGRYTQADECHLHHSFVERSNYSRASTFAPGMASRTGSSWSRGSTSSVTAGSTRSQQRTVEMSITRQELEQHGVNLFDVMEAVEAQQVSVRCKGGTATFKAPGNRDQLNTLLQNTIARLQPRMLPLTLAPPVPEGGATGSSGPLGPAPSGGGALYDSSILQSLGSLDLPSTIRIQQTVHSDQFDKNLAHERSSDRADPQPSVDSSFVLVGSGGDGGDRSRLGSQDPGHSLSQSSQDDNGPAGASTPGSSMDVDERQFKTQKGLRVSVYVGQIAAAQVDAVVSASHERLINQDGVAANIALAAGPDLQEECNQYIAQNGQLKVTEVVVTTAGALHCKGVLHAVGPRWKDYTDKTLCQQHVIDTIVNCLQKANSLGFTSVAFSSVSSGIFGVPQQMCAESYLRAVLTYEDAHGDDTRLRNIHFVDISGDMVSIIQTAFADRWDAV